MKVILLENVKRIGQIGEVINVKRGFARNFLIANKKALYASKENIDEVEFYITNPVNKEKATFGNGTQISFLVNSKDLVNNFYNTGIKLGGKDEGAPGIRSGDYYCYLRDLDGNKICAFSKIDN